MRHRLAENTNSRLHMVLPTKISGFQKLNFLSKIFEDIYDEERTIQRRADYEHLEAGAGKKALKSSQRRDMAMNGVTRRGDSIVPSFLARNGNQNFIARPRDVERYQNRRF
jgi:hypothetical protein